MPELSFRLRWPDDSETANYSPSSIIREHLQSGAAYALPDFLARARHAMAAASGRVEMKYGFPCARAGATLAAIEQYAARFNAQPGATVTILELL